MKVFNKVGFVSKGFTIVEMLVSVTLLSLVILFFTRGIALVAQVQGVQERLDLSNRIRNASYFMSKEISFATAFLHPPKPEPGFRDHLLFRNSINEIVGVFISPEGLMVYNYNQDESRVIFRETAQFQCRLVDQNLLEYKLKVSKKQYEFTIWNQLSTMNTLP